jgi:hypothetical protein
MNSPNLINNRSNNLILSNSNFDTSLLNNYYDSSLNEEREFNLYNINDSENNSINFQNLNESNDVKTFENSLIIIKDSNNISNNYKIKRGRKTKQKNSSFNTIRSKFAKDNIIRKIKTHFINNFLINLINILIKEKLNKNYIIRKLRNEISRDITIKYNIYLFNQTLEQLYSSEISNQFKSIIRKSANKKIINQIKKEDFFNKFLNIKVKDIYNIYINKNCKEILKKNYDIQDKNNKIITFNEFIKKFEQEDVYYFNLINMISDNLINYFQIKKSRKYKKKKRYKY